MALGAASAMHAGRATAARCKALVYCRHAPLGCGREGLHCADSMCERAGALRAACWTGWLRALGAGGGLQAWRAAHPSPAARRLLKVAAQEQGVEAAQHECRGRVPACIAPTADPNAQVCKGAQRGHRCEGMQTFQPEREGVLGSSSEECWPGAARTHNLPGRRGVLCLPAHAVQRCYQGTRRTAVVAGRAALYTILHYSQAENQPSACSLINHTAG